MNVVILTPDRVGSTLLQRLVTIYMLGSEQFDKPVVNLHEIVHGMSTVYSDLFKEVILQKDDSGSYAQSLGEITKMLRAASNHYWTSRLSHIHVSKRNDPMVDQAAFYEYLNNDAYIIATQRESVFEYALSRGLYAARKHRPGNVYTHEAKLADTEFLDNPIRIPKQQFVSDLNAYDEYIRWTNRYFDVNEFFIYEQDMPDIEAFISKLDFMKEKRSFNEMFDIEWNDWNKCHRLVSDVSMTNQLVLTDQTNKQEIVSHLPVKEQLFVQKHLLKYLAASKKINQAVTDGFLTNGIPIKLQTLVEKKMMIKNFNECLGWYNEWADKNGYNLVESAQQLINQSDKELKHWYETEFSSQKLLSDK